MRACEQCAEDFEQGRRDQRYCTGTCRARAARQRKAAGENAAENAKSDGPAEHDLVRAVRSELVANGVLMTVQGQIALQLARRLVVPDASGLAALADKLTAAMAAATGTGRPPVDVPPAEPVEPDDEVTRARNVRENAREAARRA